MRNQFIYIVILLAIFSFSVKATPKPPTGESFFTHGVEAYKREAYSAALKFFLNAAKMGYNTAKTHYNLGITYYRMKEFRLAYKMLLKAAKDPQFSDLAYLNAGLAAKNLNRNNLSVSLMKRAVATTQNEKLRSLAQNIIDTHKDLRSPTHRLQGLIKADFGHHSSIVPPIDNINAILTDTGDNYSFWYGKMKYRLSDNISTQITTSIMAYSQNEAYDFSSIKTSLIQQSRQGRWLRKLQMELERNYLGGKEFQESITAKLGLNYSINTKTKVDLIYNYKYIDAINKNYAYLAGNSQRFEINLAMLLLKKTRLNVLYAFELNNRDDYYFSDGLNTSFASFSPLHNSLGIGISKKLNYNATLVLNISYRNSRYVDQNIITASALPLSGDAPLQQVTENAYRRVDNRWKFRSTYLLPIYRKFSIVVQYTYYKIDSNYYQRIFSSNLVSTGLIMKF